MRPLSNVLGVCSGVVWKMPAGSLVADGIKRRKDNKEKFIYCGTMGIKSLIYQLRLLLTFHPFMDKTEANACTLWFENIAQKINYYLYNVYGHYRLINSERVR